MKIRNKILLSFLVPAVLAIITTVFCYVYAQKIVKQNVYDQLEIAADALKERVRSFLQEKMIRVIDFSSDGFIRDCTEKIANGIDFDYCTAQLNRHLLYNKQPLDTDIVEISIVDLEGKVISSTEINRVGKDVSGEPYFSKTMKKGSFISDFGYSPELKRNTFKISRLLFSKEAEKQIGIFFNVYEGDSIRDITRSGIAEELGDVRMLEGLGETGEVYIVNSDKLMIMESRFIKDTILKQVVDTEGVRVAFENRKGMVGIYPDYRGVPILGVSMYFEEMDWVILAEKDVSEAFAPVVRIRNFTIIIGITGALVIITVIILLNKSIISPINKLAAATNKIANGNITEQVRVKSKDEIGVLAGSFDTMRLELGKSFKDITKAKEDWESTFNSVTDLIALYDKDCRLIRCNNVLLSKLNVRIEDIVGKPCYEVFSIDKAKDIPECAVLEVSTTRKDTIKEEEIPCLDGIYSMSCYPHFDNNGKYTGTIQIMRNITEYKRAVDEIRLTKGKLADTQRLAHLGNWNWDIVKDELSWSDEAYRIFGLKPQEFDATYEVFLSAVCIDDREFVKKSVDNALR